MNLPGFITGFLLMTRAVIAGTSTNYTLAPDTVDNGGLRGTSANYTVNASTSPGNAGSSASYTARTGFAGQLTDPAALAINAASLTVIEGGTLQLHAALRFDDHTTTPLPADSIQWSDKGDPITGITALGLVTAGTVYEDTPAVVRGTCGIFSGVLNLTVLNTLPDNFLSYAGDGIHDSWQVLFFGIGNPLAGPLLDPDFDGQDNLFEFVAGVIPTNTASHFRFAFSPLPGQPEQIRVSFSPRFPDRTYTLMAGTDTNKAAAIPLTGGTVTDNGTERSIVDSGPDAPRKFYHIVITK